MKKLFTATLFALTMLLGGQAWAQSEYHNAAHNGSLMVVEIDKSAGTVVIRYDQPKESLVQWGVRPGTLLFSGRWNGPQLEGYAHVFPGCMPPVPYWVTGHIEPNGNLVLTGLAPVVAISPYCAVIDWTYNSANAVLVFTEVIE